MSQPSSQDILNEQVIRVKRGRMNKFGFEPAWNSYFDFYASAKYLDKPILQLEDIAFHLFLRKNINDGDPNWVMPSYRQMMNRFGISQIKIQAMLERLESAHLLLKVSGKGRGNNQSNVTNEYVLSDPIQEIDLFLTVAAAGEFPAALKSDWHATPLPVLKTNTPPVSKTATPPVSKTDTQQQTSIQQTSIEQQQQTSDAPDAAIADVVVALIERGISKKSRSRISHSIPARVNFAAN